MPDLGPQQIEAFQADGFFVVEDILTTAQVDTVKTSLSSLVEKYGTNQELADVIPGDTGSIATGTRIQRRDSPFFFQLEKGQEPKLNNPEALELQVRKFMFFEEETEIFREILSDKGTIATIARQILEDEPVLFQSMALIKPPKIGATKPWHQDNAYFSVSPLEAVCGVWIAIDEATVKNGCMHMLKGQHAKGPMLHEHRRDCEINVSRLDLSTLVPVPMKPGSALFFSGLIPHETPPNRSDSRRRALQFHFRGSQSEILTGPEYDKLFHTAEGLPASCEAIRREGV